MRYFMRLAGIGVAVTGLALFFGTDHVYPQVQVLGPTRGVGEADLDSFIFFDSALGGGVGSPAAQQITQSHRTAQQQVQLALTYLTTNREQILAGEDDLYNQVFGRFYDPNPQTNPFIGQYQRTVETARLNSDPLGTFGTVSIDQGSSQLEGDETAFLSEVAPGQKIFIGNPLTGGEVHRVAEVVDDENIILEDFARVDFDGASLRQVDSIGPEPNTSHFNQVVSTFANIRDALNRPTQYNGAFDQGAFDAAFADGNAVFPGLEGFLDRPADRALRQAGFSSSNTPKHIANLEQLVSNGQIEPLLWTEDNDLVDSTGALLDEPRAFFNNFMTIFGENDNPNNQFVGPAFLNEERNFAADFFDNSVAVQNPQIDPQTGLPVAGTGNPIQAPTELKQWQMIIKSFAEHSTDFSLQGTAAFGIMDIQNQFFPQGSPAFLENRDAGNFAQFADLVSQFGNVAQDRIEPFGKRGLSDFNPGVSTFLPIIPAD